MDASIVLLAYSANILAVVRIPAGCLLGNKCSAACVTAADRPTIPKQPPRIGKDYQLTHISGRHFRVDGAGGIPISPGGHFYDGVISRSQLRLVSASEMSTLPALVSQRVVPATVGKQSRSPSPTTADHDKRAGCALGNLSCEIAKQFLASTVALYTQYR